MNFLKPLLDIVLPPRCKSCGKIVDTDHSLCEMCFQKVEFISAPYCLQCGMPLENIDESAHHLICPNCLKKKPKARLQRSAVLYNDFAQDLILAFKFGDRTDLKTLFAKWMFLAARDSLKQGIDVIIPVPLSYRRLVVRRYNQAAVLAKEVAKLTQTPIDAMNLIKIRHTKPQSRLQKSARVKNIKNAYRVKCPERIRGKRVLLIDDVMTTGATLNECVKLLLKNGALSVDTLTLARVKKRLK